MCVIFDLQKKVGKMMAEFPLDPQLAKALVSSPKFGCSNEVVTIVSLLSVPPLFIRSRDCERESDQAKAKFSHQDGDHLSMLNVYHAWQQNMESDDWAYDNYLNNRNLRNAKNIRNQLMGIMNRLSLQLKSIDFSSEEYYPSIRRSLLSGFFMQVGHLENQKTYLTVKDNQVVRLHPSTSMDRRPEWVMYHEFVLTSQNYVRTVTAVRGEWLLELASHYYDLNHFPDGGAKRALRSLQSQMTRSYRMKKSSRRAAAVPESYGPSSY